MSGPAVTIAKLREALGHSAEAPGRTTFECRCCGAYVDGTTDGHFDDPKWGRLSNIDGPDAICPACMKDPSSLDPLRNEYPNVRIVDACRDRARVPSELERRIIELEEALVAMDFVCSGGAISHEDACRHEAVVQSAMDAVRARRQIAAEAGKEAGKCSR